MVGITIPISIEGGGKEAKNKVLNQMRRGSCTLSRKPLQKKDSRSKIKIVNVQIHLEGATSNGTIERSLEPNALNRPSTKKRSAQVCSISNNENARKCAIANKCAGHKDPGDFQKSLTRRLSNGKTNGGTKGSLVNRKILSSQQSSCKDLGLAQGSSGIMKLMSRRQSSTKDLLGMDTIRRMSDAKIVIRRDSVNGLRILTKDTENEDDEKKAMDTLERLRLISLDSTKKFSKFETDALETHNKYRARHNVVPLELSKELCEKAQDYAEELAESNVFEHSGDPIYGENLYWSWSSDPEWVLAGDEPVDSWYQEKKGYDYKNEPSDCESGHFTQLVWAKSTHLGVGVAKSVSTGKYFCVMKYDPAGNYIGRYRENVLKPSSFG